MYRTALILMLGLLAGCSSGGGSSQLVLEDGERVFEINHYRYACQGEGTFMCLLEKQAGREDWYFLYGGVIGFDYQWGYTYKLLVEERPVEEPLADGPSVEYHLKQVLTAHEASASEEFEVSILKAHHLLQKQSPGNYLLGWEKAFTCYGELCDSVDAIMAQEMSMLAVFTHREDKNAPLQLQRILCSDIGSAYYTSCFNAD